MTYQCFLDQIALEKDSVERGECDGLLFPFAQDGGLVYSDRAYAALLDLACAP